MKIKNYMQLRADTVYDELPEDVKVILSLFSDEYIFNAAFSGDEVNGGFIDIWGPGNEKLFFCVGITNPKRKVMEEFVQWVRDGMKPGKVIDGREVE